MNKGQILICILIAFFLFSACSDSTDNTNDKQALDNTGLSQEDNKNNEVKDVSIDEQIIYEGNNIKVTATGLDIESTFGPSITVLIENSSSQDITVQAKHFSVNNVMVNTIFSADVAAGKKANDSITIMSNDLELANITTIKDLEFSLHVIDTDSWDTIVDTETISLKTSADASFVQSYDDSGFKAYDSDGIKIVVKKLNSSDSFWGSDVYLYIDNSTNNDITIQARDVSINGFMIDPIFSSDILANKKAFDTITFMESDLTDNSISDITEIELKFHIIDMNSWDIIKDTDIIKILF